MHLYFIFNKEINIFLLVVYEVFRGEKLIQSNERWINTPMARAQ